MKTKVLFVLSALVIILSLIFAAGCSSNTSAAATTTPPAAVPPTIASPPAFTSQPAGSVPIIVNNNGQQGLWVNGQGSVNVTPNIATLNLGVSEQAAKVADAQAQAATDMNNVMTALTSGGVATKDIATQYYSINQLTQYNPGTQQSTVTGYQVTNNVTVTVRNIAQTGAIIDAVAAAGGDATRFNGISFSVDDPTQYYTQARSLAMTDAKTKAAQLAGLAGVTLGKAFYIIENSPGIVAPVAPGLSAGISAQNTPINPGTMTITLYLQVAYAIQ
jgi:uncharacterized protein